MWNNLAEDSKSIWTYSEKLNWSIRILYEKL